MIKISVSTETTDMIKRLIIFRQTGTAQCVVKDLVGDPTALSMSLGAMLSGAIVPSVKPALAKILC